MPKLLVVFFWGLVISFLGSLPLGTLNIAAMQIGIQESILNAIYFSIGSLLVEMVYVRISLVGIDWVRKQERIMKAMEWITFFIIAALAAGSCCNALARSRAWIRPCCHARRGTSRSGNTRIPASTAMRAATCRTGMPMRDQWGFTAMTRSSGHAGAMRRQA